MGQEQLNIRLTEEEIKKCIEKSIEAGRARPCGVLDGRMVVKEEPGIQKSEVRSLSSVLRRIIRR